MVRAPLAVSIFVFLGLLRVGTVQAQAPPEVQNLDFSDTATLSWSAAAGADHHNVYRGELAVLASPAEFRASQHAEARAFLRGLEAGV